jgi:hypothetical protein
MRFRHADAKHLLAEIRQVKPQDTVRDFAQQGLDRLGQVKGVDRLIRLTVAFLPRHLGEEQALVGEIAVEGRLGDLRLSCDLVHAGTFEAVTHEDAPRAFKHLIELAPFFDFCGLRRHAPLPLSVQCSRPRGRGASLRVSARRSRTRYFKGLAVPCVTVCGAGSGKLIVGVIVLALMLNASAGVAASATERTRAVRVCFMVISISEPFCLLYIGICPPCVKPILNNSVHFWSKVGFAIVTTPR